MLWPGIRPSMEVDDQRRRAVKALQMPLAQSEGAAFSKHALIRPALPQVKTSHQPFDERRRPSNSVVPRGRQEICRGLPVGLDVVGGIAERLQTDEVLTYRTHPISHPQSS